VQRIGFMLDARVTPRHDAAIVFANDDPVDALAEAVVESISTDVKLRLGGVTIHLAMLRDPDHWESDWAERGIDDPYEWVAGLVEAS